MLCFGSAHTPNSRGPVFLANLSTLVHYVCMFNSPSLPPSLPAYLSIQSKLDIITLNTVTIAIQSLDSSQSNFASYFAFVTVTYLLNAPQPRSRSHGDFQK